MKNDFVKKSLIKKAVICLVIIIIMAGVTFFTMSYDDSLIADIDKIKSDTTGNESQYVVTVKQVQEAKDALEFYSDYSSSESSVPENFRRDFAKNLLGKLKDQLNLVDLKFSMDQFQKKPGDFTKKHMAFFTSKVTIQLAANSDIEVLTLIKNLSQSFPGSVNIASYKITRKNELTEDFMKKLNDDTLSKGMVDGEVIFEWGTILDNPDDVKKDDKAPADATPKPGQPNG